MNDESDKAVKAMTVTDALDLTTVRVITAYDRGEIPRNLAFDVCDRISKLEAELLALRAAVREAGESLELGTHELLATASWSTGEGRKLCEDSATTLRALREMVKE